MKFKKWILFVFLAVALCLVFFYDLPALLNLDYIKDQQQRFHGFYLNHKTMTLLVFFLAYVAVAALSIPGAAVLTLLAGALFGLGLGVLIVSFASTIGATLAFLTSRFLLRDYVQSKFGQRLKAIHEGVRREGAFYLFSLRLIPIFPFFVINLLMGLTAMPVFTFYWVSQLGMLPGTVVYVNAGTQLAQIDSLSGIVSIEVLLSLALLGVFPLLAKKSIDFFKGRKAYAKYGSRRPKKADYNIVVIGAGSAGLVTTYIGVQAQAKVALIESNKMGGDCLNTGCVPSKALIRSAKLAHQINNASHWALPVQNPLKANLSEIMGRVQKVISQIEPHDSVERYESMGADCIKGLATILSPWEVQVNGKVLTTRNIVIATGASPIIPNIPGVDSVSPLTSENLWQLKELPQRLLVIGGGPIGCELAQAFQRLGAKVTLVEKSHELLKDGSRASEILVAQFQNEKMQVLLNTSIESILHENGAKVAQLKSGEKDLKVEFDEVLFAVGRKANVQGLGLKELDVRLTEQGTIQVNDFLQTSVPNIYACGDVVGPYQLTHAASHQAWFCAVNAMASPFKRFRVDYRVMPWCTFTDPEVAHVGLQERTAKELGLEYEVTTYEVDDLDRAIADGENQGFVEVLTKKGSDEILGATIVSSHAGELISEFVLAMKHRLGLGKILGTTHIYPTWAEANKFAAGQWRKNHINPRLLRFARKFQSFRR